MASLPGRFLKEPLIHFCAAGALLYGAYALFAPGDPRSLYLPGQRPVKADPDPPEISWQDEARETSEQRRRHLLDCGVD